MTRDNYLGYVGEYMLLHLWLSVIHKEWIYRCVNPTLSLSRPVRTSPAYNSTPPCFSYFVAGDSERFWLDF